MTKNCEYYNRIIILLEKEKAASSGHGFIMNQALRAGAPTRH